MCGVLCKPEVEEEKSELKKLQHIQLSGVWHELDMATEMQFSVTEVS